MHPEDRLKEILDTMDIPSQRKEVGIISNLSWLNRNIGIRNSNHPQFDEAILCIRMLMRDLYA